MTGRRWQGQLVGWLLSLLALASSPAPLSAESPADLVLRGGVVHTLSPARPLAEAVAVRAGRIVAVGSTADVAPFLAPATRVIELRGRTLVPGFDDAHAHLLGIGYQRLDVDLTGSGTWEEAVSRVSAAVAGRAKGEWIRGRGWHEGKWARPAAGSVRGFPTHDALSAVTPDNPVLLERADGHAVLANARAMALRGVTRESAAPAGGEIVRDASGQPTGVFVDHAETLVTPPARSDRERQRAFELALEECRRSGVTSLSDAGAEIDTIGFYRRQAEAGRLTLRLYVMAAGPETLRELAAPERGRGGGFLTVRAVKLYADGALGSRGAALLEPYADDPGNSGLLLAPPARLEETTREALRRGFQVATHAIGDRANRLVLDAYERALGAVPQARDPRLRVEHAQILDAAEISRFARLRVVASMQGSHCPSDRPWAVARLAPARVAEGAYVWRKLLASGARIANGTDAPVEPLSPIRSFHALVTRQDEQGQPPGGFDPDQKLTRQEALRAMTLEAAYASFEEESQGSLEVGKRADMVVLSQDILAAADGALLATEVVATIVDGRVVYEKPAGLSAAR